MVKYYGRARQRTGSVNTNQIGLKMSGCPSKVGRKGTIDRYISRRSQCNQKYCGPVFYHGQIWNWNNGRCVAKAPRGQSFNSGVGTKVGNPRFACGNTCAVDITYAAAIKTLRNYFVNAQGSMILIGSRETLETDLAPNVLAQFQSAGPVWPIKHYEKGNKDFEDLPGDIKGLVTYINNLNIKGPIKKGGTPVSHIVGWASYADQGVLLQNGYGSFKHFGPGPQGKRQIVLMFNLGDDILHSPCFTALLVYGYFCAAAIAVGVATAELPGVAEITATAALSSCGGPALYKAVLGALVCYATCWFTGKC